MERLSIRSNQHVEPEHHQLATHRTSGDVFGILQVLQARTTTTTVGTTTTTTVQTPTWYGGINPTHSLVTHFQTPPSLTC
jgi:hypothetical protein